MTVTPREALALTLSQAAPDASSSIGLRAKASDLRLEVAGFGPVTLPVTKAQAARLCELGRPARFGRGERTLTDRAVRDTWEVPKDLVTPTWSPVFEATLEKVRGGLGLPSGTRLTADLHSLLVYEKGQFFVAHQDSEKDDAMVATLVVVLPSAHTGGELVVHRGEQATTYRGSKTAITMAAFYADCRHEVLPVTAGHRIALSYNLSVAGGRTDPAGTDNATTAELVRLLEAHFTTQQRAPYGDRVLDPPNRLVYLLDHEYTEKGLSWSRLKGADAERAALLKDAADQGGCELVLALAEIQETWDALEPEYRYSRRRWSDDAPRNSGPEDYELTDLLDSSLTLTRWGDPAGTWVQDINLTVDEGETCTGTPTVELRPYESEYEGYMGNYGNTMDRWYRRAALVVWPSASSFAVRAEISPLQALEEVVAAVPSRRRSGRGKDAGPDDTQARTDAVAAVAVLAPFWTAAVDSSGDQSKYLTQGLRAAKAIDDIGAVTTLLSPFRIEALRRGHMKPLAQLAERHGEAWVGKLLQGWFGDPRRSGRYFAGSLNRPQWLTHLPELGRALVAAPGSVSAIGHHLVTSAWHHLAAEFDACLADSKPSRVRSGLAPLGEPLAALLETTAVLDCPDVRDRILGDVRRRPDDVAVALLGALRAGAALSSEVRAEAGLPELAADCANRLRARLSLPERGDGDWSIELPAGCTCDLCDRLAVFLQDRNETSFDWPLAQARRAAPAPPDRATQSCPSPTRPDARGAPTPWS